MYTKNQLWNHQMQIGRIFENKFKHLGFILVLSADNLRYHGYHFFKKLEVKCSLLYLILPIYNFGGSGSQCCSIFTVRRD